MAMLETKAPAPGRRIEVPIKKATGPGDDKIHTWPHLVRSEFLVACAVIVLPSFIILGLMVIPYIDINPKGNGYYCWKDRRWEILTFFLGFHILWVSLIIIGTFVRGPGWNWFWFWEKWDPHKVEALTNVDLPFLLGARSDMASTLIGAALVLGYFVVGFAAFWA